jgi:hypothetical protein
LALAALALAALALALVSSQFVAQTSHSQKPQDNSKIKVRDDRMIVRDKSKPVRRALEELYAKIAEAQRNEDVKALRATRTPDFTVEMPTGHKWELESAVNLLALSESNQLSASQTNWERHSCTGDKAIGVVH